MRTIIRTALSRNIILITGITVLFMMASPTRTLSADDALWHMWRDSGLHAWEEGRLGEAERRLVTAMEEAEKFGPDDLRVADSANDLAIVYATAGITTEAELLFHRALMIGKNGLGMDHPAVGATIQNLGILYAMQKKYQEAELLMLRALEINLTRFGVVHARTVSTLKILYTIYVLQHQLVDVEPFILNFHDLQVNEAILI